jgi:hypothetical protein
MLCVCAAHSLGDKQKDLDAEHGAEIIFLSIDGGHSHIFLEKQVYENVFGECYQCVRPGNTKTNASE